MVGCMVDVIHWNSLMGFKSFARGLHLISAEWVSIASNVLVLIVIM